MQIGIAPINWTNDDFPLLGGKISFEQCLSEMEQAGYDGCEIGRKFPTDPNKLLQHTTLHNLEICNYWFNFELTTKSLADNLNQLKDRIAFQKSVNCNIIGGGEVGNSTYCIDSVSAIDGRIKLLSASEWKKFGFKLNECGKLIRDNGLELAFHHHVGTIIQSIDEVERLLENTDPNLVKLNFDSGHFHLAGENAADALQRIMDRVIHVHLKNVRADVLKSVIDQQLDYQEAISLGIFTVPGDPDGAIDFEPIFQTLERHSYDRWLIVEAEQDPVKANPLKYAMMAREYIRERIGY